MKNAAVCPNTEELRQLIDGSLSGERQQACTEHLERCQGCQSSLENIATDGSNLSQLIERVHESEPVAQSAYWPAVRALEAESQQTFVPRSAPQTLNVSLSFLQPASDSAYLGRLAHFDVMRVLGRGGMGLVLEAFDSRLQRNVAIKVLDPELAGDDTARQRFCREARAAASITHENVVAVHQVEKSGAEGLPYLVMQLITGESLEQRLSRDRKMSIREIVQIGRQAAHGLAAAHAQGMIHRDVKPGNILLESSSDRVKLTDFGLAQVTDDVKLTRTGYVSGTPLYMSPEQALGEQVDHRSDLFSLGAVLYEMCAGKPPFNGNSALAILKQISEAKPQSVCEVNPAVPEWLDDTILSLLSKKPADRIPSAEQLAELFDFEWALMKASSEEVPTVCEVEQRKIKVRNRWIALGVAAAFLSLGLFGGQFLANRNPVPNAPVSSAEPAAVLSANAGPVWAVAFNPAKTDQVAMAIEDGSVRLWDLSAKSITSTFTAHRGIVWASQFSRDGKLFVTAGDDGLIKLRDLAQDREVGSFEHANAVRGFVFSHDEKTLYAGSRDGVLRAWAVDSKEMLAEARQSFPVYAVALSPDGETLATAGSDKVVRLWNAKNLSPKLTLEGHAGSVFGISFHRDGRRLASVGWDHIVRIWDVGSGQIVKSWNGHADGDIWGVAYSPDGKKLATAGHDGAVKLWNPETGDLLTTWLGHKVAVHTVAFSHEGTLVASGGRDGAVRIWKVE